MGLITIKTDVRNGRVADAVQVKPGDEVIFITDAGTLIRVSVNDVSEIGRNTKGVKLITTSARAEKTAFQLDLSPRPLAIVLGNETMGISEKLKKLNLEMVSLPMSASGASSLNVTVAAGALLYEAVRQASKH